MDWLIDDLVLLDEDEVSRWLAGRGLPGVRFLFWDQHGQRCVSWREAGEADRRRVLETIARGVASAPPLDESAPSAGTGLEEGRPGDAGRVGASVLSSLWR